MSTNDLELAFQALNIEPLYGHFAHMPSTFRRVVPNPAGTGTKGTLPVYFVEDEEIDFDKVLRDERVVLPKMVNWHAHWLAVEGIQPLTADNPPKPPLSGTITFPRPNSQIYSGIRSKGKETISPKICPGSCCTRSSKRSQQKVQASQARAVARVANLLLSPYRRFAPFALTDCR